MSQEPKEWQESVGKALLGIFVWVVIILVAKGWWDGKQKEWQEKNRDAFPFLNRQSAPPQPQPFTPTLPPQLQERPITKEQIDRFRDGHLPREPQGSIQIPQFPQVGLRGFQVTPNDPLGGMGGPQDNTIPPRVPGQPSRPWWPK
jgi:hypothetical protein